MAYSELEKEVWIFKANIKILGSRSARAAFGFLTVNIAFWAFG